jgi:biotin transport system substrate-specific component
MKAMRSATLCQAVIPRANAAADAALVVGFAFLTAVAAQVRLPLPFTPVPVTGQTFAVLLCGAALGSARGALAQGLYLALACAGLPVLAGARPAFPLGPTAGYLVGFIAAAYLVGRLVERGWDRRLRTAAPAMALGSAVIYAFGLAWLTLYLGVPLARALALGVWPFIPGDILKLALAAGILPSAWALVRRHADS